MIKEDNDLLEMKKYWHILPIQIIKLIDSFYQICNKCYNYKNTKYHTIKQYKENIIESCSIKCSNCSSLNGSHIGIDPHCCQWVSGSYYEHSSFINDTIKEAIDISGYKDSIGDYGQFLYELDKRISKYEDIDSHYIAQCFLEQNIEEMVCPVIEFEYPIPFDINSNEHFKIFNKLKDDYYQIRKLSIIINEPFTKEIIIYLNSHVCWTKINLVDAICNSIKDYMIISNFVPEYSNYYIYGLRYNMFNRSEDVGEYNVYDLVTKLIRN